MFFEPSDRPSSCADSCGTMPSCAPLAVPYVPFQQTSPKKYSKADALANGTLFPALNLPFKAKVNAAGVADTALSQLQALEFVLQELTLYLDTHSDDQEAFALFKEYAAMEAEARHAYEEMYGPLTSYSAASGEKYRWLCGNWPWNYPEGSVK